MKWLGVGKKYYKINHLKTKVKVILFPEPVTYDMRKDLEQGNWEVLESIK